MVFFIYYTNIKKGGMIDGYTSNHTGHRAESKI